MSLRIEKRLLIALPVNVDEVRPQIAQQRLRSELIVDEDFVTPGGGELATNDQFISRAYPCILENSLEIRIRRDEEEPFNRRTLSACLDQLIREPATDQN